MISFVDSSDYDILYSSNEPDYLTVVFSLANKPVYSRQSLFDVTAVYFTKRTDYIPIYDKFY